MFIHLILHAPFKVIDILLDGPLLNQLEKRVEPFVEEVFELVYLPMKPLDFFRARARRGLPRGAWGAKSEGGGVVGSQRINLPAKEDLHIFYDTLEG